MMKTSKTDQVTQVTMSLNIADLPKESYANSGMAIMYQFKHQSKDVFIDGELARHLRFRFRNVK